jgi:hypothetical protein
MLGRSRPVAGASHLRSNRWVPRFSAEINGVEVAFETAANLFSPHALKRA